MDSSSALEQFGATLGALDIPMVNLSNGLTAMSFLKTVSQMGGFSDRAIDYIEGPPNSPRSVHRRWTIVFKLVRSVLGVDIPREQRDAIFCGEESEARKFLLSVFIQVKEMEAFRLIVQTAHKDKSAKRRDVSPKQLPPPQQPLHECTCHQQCHVQPTHPRVLHPYTGVDIHEPLLLPFKHVASIGVGTSDGRVKLKGETAALVSRLTHRDIERKKAVAYLSMSARTPEPVLPSHSHSALHAKSASVRLPARETENSSEGKLPPVGAFTTAKREPRRSPPKRKSPLRISHTQKIGAQREISSVQQSPATIERREKARKLLEEFQQTTNDADTIHPRPQPLELQPSKSLTPPPPSAPPPPYTMAPKSPRPHKKTRSQPRPRVEHAATETPPLVPSVTQLVVRVQSFCRHAISQRHALQMCKRAPAADFIQHVWRHALLERTRLANPPPYEQFPSKPLTTCLRCYAILAALQNVVEAKHVPKKVNKYVAQLCPECKSIAPKIVEETQLCNAHRFDPISMKVILRIQASFRWHLSLSVVDHQIYLSHLAYAHKFERVPRQAHVLLLVQLRFLFIRWRRRRQKLNRAIKLDQSTSGGGDRDENCRRCGPIVESLIARSRSIVLVPETIAKYTSLMCRNCAELTTEVMRQSAIRRCEYSLGNVVATIILTVNMLKRRGLRRWRCTYSSVDWLLRSVNCRRCVPILQAMIVRLIHRRRERQTHRYARILCHSCRRVALRGIMLANAASCAHEVLRLTWAKRAAMRWIGRTASVEAIDKFGDTCFRDAPILFELEKRLLANPELPKSTIDLYTAVLCKRCAVTIQQRRTSAKDVLRAVLFVQQRIRWKLFARELADRRIRELYTVETVCLRCDPIKDALHSRLCYNANLPLKVLKRFPSVMCKLCKERCDGALDTFERKRVAARNIQLVYRFHRIKAKLKKRSAFPSRGECQRCGPIVQTFKRVVASCAVSRAGESVDVQRKAIHPSYKRYVAAACRRCRQLIHSMYRTENYSDVAAMINVVVPQLPLHRIPHMPASVHLLSADDRTNFVSCLQAFARARLSSKVVQRGAEKRHNSQPLSHGTK